MWALPLEGGERKKATATEGIDLGAVNASTLGKGTEGRKHSRSAVNLFGEERIEKARNGLRGKGAQGCKPLEGEGARDGGCR